MGNLIWFKLIKIKIRIKISEPTSIVILNSGPPVVDTRSSYPLYEVPGPDMYLEVNRMII